MKPSMRRKFVALLVLVCAIPFLSGPLQAGREKEICNNDMDDDNDGKIDCADPNCKQSGQNQQQTQQQPGPFFLWR